MHLVFRDRDLAGARGHGDGDEQCTSDASDRVPMPSAVDRGPVPQTFNEGVHSGRRRTWARVGADCDDANGARESPGQGMGGRAARADDGCGRADGEPRTQAAYGGPYPHKQIAIMTSLLFDVLRVVAEEVYSVSNSSFCTALTPTAARITPSLASHVRIHALLTPYPPSFAPISTRAGGLRPRQAAQLKTQVDMDIEASAASNAQPYFERAPSTEEKEEGWTEGEARHALCLAISPPAPSASAYGIDIDAPACRSQVEESSAPDTSRTSQGDLTRGSRRVLPASVAEGGVDLKGRGLGQAAAERHHSPRPDTGSRKRSYAEAARAGHIPSPSLCERASRRRVCSADICAGAVVDVLRSTAGGAAQVHPRVLLPASMAGAPNFQSFDGGGARHHGGVMMEEERGGLELKVEGEETERDGGAAKRPTLL
ncbi:hypothetical protein B0H14DRAFT_3897577 [Mycena olivaceomarginata]|nr:hypothetical protein B0H14DRAFT_3897577 [Mycena olivaceomarginata]